MSPVSSGIPNEQITSTTVEREKKKIEEKIGGPSMPFSTENDEPSPFQSQTGKKFRKSTLPALAKKEIIPEDSIEDEKLLAGRVPPSSGVHAKAKTQSQKPKHKRIFDSIEDLLKGKQEKDNTDPNSQSISRKVRNEYSIDVSF